LKDSWDICHESGVVYKLKFNMSLNNPNLSDGWNDIKQFNDFPDDVEVVFGYYGSNVFGVIMCREVNRYIDLPCFHSRSLYPMHTMFFDITLWDKDLTSPILVSFELCFLIICFITSIYSHIILTNCLKMQTLPKAFGMFLKNQNIDTLTICGDNGKELQLEVYLRNGQQSTVIIGTKWNQFCKDNNFKASYTYRFKLSAINFSICHVYLEAPFTYASISSV
jgi:hypothetical protein